MRFSRSSVVLAVMTVMAFAGCGIHSNGSSTEGARITVPESGMRDSSGLGSIDTEDLTQQMLSPKVPIPKEFNLAQVQNLNLNLDQSEEQVLVLKSRDNPDAPISIGVVDLDPARNQYVLSWTHPTLATNVRTFSVAAEDVIGDHALEIICVGTNDKGEQTMDVFRKTHAPAGPDLFYSEIFQSEIRGTIEIERHDRSQAYKLGQQNGSSFPIITTTQDPTSNRIGDLMQTTYTWNPAKKEYAQTEVAKLPGKQIDDQRLTDLFAAGSDAFDSFLSGPWYKVSGSTGDGTGDVSSSVASVSAGGDRQGFTILFFDPVSREVSFYAGDVMEIYDWENSYRTLYNSLVISGYNQLVQYIKAQISIAVSSPDEILLYSPDEWAGTYMRLTKSMQDSLVHHDQPAFQPPELSGEYLSDSGAKLNFQSDRFSLEDNKGVQTGGFEIFRFGLPVIELRFINRSGIVTDTRTYELGYQQEKGQSRIVRTLKLTPGLLGIHGFAPNGANPIHYVQIEELKQPQ